MMDMLDAVGATATPRPSLRLPNGYIGVWLSLHRLLLDIVKLSVCVINLFILPYADPSGS